MLSFRYVCITKTEMAGQFVVKSLNVNIMNICSAVHREVVRVSILCPKAVFFKAGFSLVSSSLSW
jgi:hypothetical protein